MKTVTTEEFNQALSEQPTNAELRYLIEYTDKADEAWEVLAKRVQSNGELQYLIECTSKKEEAAAIMLKQNPTLSNLNAIIECCSDETSMKAQEMKERLMDAKMRMIDVIKLR